MPTQGNHHQPGGEVGEGSGEGCRQCLGGWDMWGRQGKVGEGTTTTARRDREREVGVVGGGRGRGGKVVGCGSMCGRGQGMWRGAGVGEGEGEKAKCPTWGRWGGVEGHGETSHPAQKRSAARASM